jgi:hypothetical protein
MLRASLVVLLSCSVDAQSVDTATLDVGPGGFITVKAGGAIVLGHCEGEYAATPPSKSNAPFLRP